jgi:transposase, IS5 family
LNEAREQTEEIIDILYEELDDNENKKPRTYRNTARKEYLDVAKKRRPSKKQRIKAIKKQLQYLKRNLSYIQDLRNWHKMVGGVKPRHVAIKIKPST